MRLVLIGLLVLFMASTASAADLTKGTPANATSFEPTRDMIYCSGVNADNAFYENGIYAYGNMLSVGEENHTLTTLDFLHYGWGFAGPYDYDLLVYDALTCTVVHEVNGLVAADAAEQDVQELVDLCPYNMVVTGDLFVLIHPLSCYVPTDCYPDLYFDISTPPDGCGVRAEVGVPESCVQILSSSGVVDFLQGITIDECEELTGACCIPGALCQILTEAECLAGGGTYIGDGSLCDPDPCVVPVEVKSWSAVKALYR